MWDDSCVEERESCLFLSLLHNVGTSGVHGNHRAPSCDEMAGALFIPLHTGQDLFYCIMAELPDRKISLNWKGSALTAVGTL